MVIVQQAYYAAYTYEHDSVPWQGSPLPGF